VSRDHALRRAAIALSDRILSLPLPRGSRLGRGCQPGRPRRAGFGGLIRAGAFARNHSTSPEHVHQTCGFRECSFRRKAARLYEFRDSSFRVIARGAFKSVPLITRVIRLDASEHHPGCAFFTDRPNDRVRPLRGVLKEHRPNPTTTPRAPR